MAHIASCMAGLEPSSSPKPGSPASAMLSSTPPPVPSEKPFTWRMQSEGHRKYQLFPRGRQSPSFNGSASVDPETAFALAMGQNSEKTEKASLAAGLKIKISQQNPIRRRKISVPEPGPMTTVQEIAMDSPTIPGRPPLHERSVSAPGEGCRLEELTLPSATFQTLSDAVYRPMRSFERQMEMQRNQAGSPAPRLPSPKRLAPLVIPGATLRPHFSELARPSPFLHLRSDSTPPPGTSQSSLFENSLIRSRLIPTPSPSDFSSGSMSASTDALSTTTLPTPVSAPLIECRGYSQPSMSATQVEDARSHSYGHRRFASESSSSVMDRGRPRNRPESRNNTNSPLPAEPKRSKSSERRAFEELPQGWKPCDVINHMNVNDVTIVRKQAIGQAERFEVLRAEDVEALSKELRRLDERTEYLRRTYKSLRAGRRNLHSRICQYLRSPRMARFSHESMLKQEEALAELDASIDDWVDKLERAENRRTRVRQKLLEHVAAAAILPGPGGDCVPQPPPPPPRGIPTPPRSPTKPTFTSRAGSTSPSPQRVVAQVPSAILELPAVEEVEEEDKDGMLSRKSTLRRSGVESIRIYAGDELFALLSDVEEEIFRMSYSPTESDRMEEPESQLKKQHQRKSSQPDSPTIAVESMFTMAHPRPPMPAPLSRPIPTIPITKLTTHLPTPIDLNASVPLSPPAPTPPMKDIPREAEIFLTSAVFKPI